MNSHNKKTNPTTEYSVQIDPTVEYLTQMFPEDLLRNLAQKTGFIKRMHKIDPVTFF